MVTIQDFQNFEIIVAQIKEVKEHSNADRLYVLKIDTGSGEKQIVAGVRKNYTPEQLLGRKIIVINNLQPAMLRGEESSGMMLVASTEDGQALLMPDKDVPVGTKIK
ncbi:MAG: methionine--tRNA ligase subunit beta [Candidatus Omnitrophica bacterium CG12_big_fil_rev_8_21_14_0_65_50_5]|nr:MAG: methionine--tRNA ligase subunit beta [Candidatus Omnitrophica bacterium CG12_big_fil_rev_8_21_14_0_65_50_5]